MLLSDAYRRWNDALGAEYFRGEDAGRPTYLAVDDDELAELADRVGVERADASNDFIKTVRHEAWRSGDLFRLMVRERLTWRSNTTQVPPYIALLGLCVLAASRMARDPDAGVWSTDYYSQLNPLLGRERHGGRPPNFETLRLLWEDLTRWLDEDLRGQRGASTVSTHAVFVHIGYPISQCLLRASDRRALPDFFRAVGLEPGDDVSGERLFVLLRAWARPGCSLTAYGQRVVANAAGSSEEALTEMLTREFAHWDGELRDERGRRRSDISIFAETLAGGRRIELRLYALQPEGFPEGTWTLRSGTTVELAASGHGWYRRLPVDVTSKHLRDGLHMTCGDFALALDGADAIPMRASFLPEAGWLSIRQATALEEHLVLVHANAESSLRAFLQRHAEAGWVLSQPAGDLPSDWLTARRVRISSVPEAVPDELQRLVPRLNTAMRLEGGLPLARRLGLYLEGGEPDLWINIEDQGGAVIEIDGSATELKTGIVKLPLSALKLPAGTHAVTAPGEKRRFSSITTYGRAVPEGAETLGHVLERHSGYLPQTPSAVEVRSSVPRGQVIISGAHVRANADDLPANPYPPVVLRNGYQRYTLLGAVPGRVATVEPPAEPSWLQRLRPLPTFQFFEVEGAFRVQLVVYTGKTGVRLRQVPAEVTQPLVQAQACAPAAQARWADAILAAESVGIEVPPELAEVWSAYVDQARAVANGAPCDTTDS